MPCATRSSSNLDSPVRECNKVIKRSTTCVDLFNEKEVEYSCSACKPVIDITDFSRKKRKKSSQTTIRNKCEQPWLSRHATNTSKLLFHAKVCSYLKYESPFIIEEEFKCQSKNSISSLSSSSSTSADDSTNSFKSTLSDKISTSHKNNNLKLSKATKSDYPKSPIQMKGKSNDKNFPHIHSHKEQTLFQDMISQKLVACMRQFKPMQCEQPKTLYLLHPSPNMD